MTQNLIAVMFSLLRYEIGQGDALGEEERAFCSEQMELLYKLSKKHDIAHLIGDALSKQKLLESGDEWAQKFQKERLLALYRYEQLNFALGEICQTLEAAEIPFLPLKGSVIRPYYPEPWMRTSCDIDVLVHEEDLDRAVAALTEGMNYRSGVKGSHDIPLFSPGGMHIELHYVLVEDDVANQANATLSNVWQYTCEKEGYTYHMVMSDEMFYFYHIAHMAKHFEYGGCGIRSFLDLWILEQKIVYDTEKRDELLKKGDLFTFAMASEMLSKVWFGDGMDTEVTQSMEKYILHGGVYGTMDNKVAVQQKRKGGKVKYLFSRVFLPYNSIKFHYPILEKHRWLMPFMQVRRWFKLIFLGGLKRSVNEISINATLSKEQQDSTQQLLKQLGL